MQVVKRPRNERWKRERENQKWQSVKQTVISVSTRKTKMQSIVNATMHFKNLVSVNARLFSSHGPTCSGAHTVVKTSSRTLSASSPDLASKRVECCSCPTPQCITSRSSYCPTVAIFLTTKDSNSSSHALSKPRTHHPLLPSQALLGDCLRLACDDRVRMLLSQSSLRSLFETSKQLPCRCHHLWTWSQEIHDVRASCKRVTRCSCGMRRVEFDLMAILTEKQSDVLLVYSFCPTLFRLSCPVVGPTLPYDETSTDLYVPERSDLIQENEFCYLA